MIENPSTGSSSDILTYINALIVSIKLWGEKWIEASKRPGLPILLKADFEARAEEDERVATLLSETFQPTVLSKVGLTKINQIIFNTVDMLATTASVVAPSPAPETEAQWNPTEIMQKEL